MSLAIFPWTILAFSSPHTALDMLTEYMNWSHCFIIIRYAFWQKFYRNTLCPYNTCGDHWDIQLRWHLSCQYINKWHVGDNLRLFKHPVPHRILTDGFSIDNSWLNQKCKMVAWKFKKLFSYLLLFFINLSISTISIIHCIPLCLLYSFILRINSKNGLWGQFQTDFSRFILSISFFPDLFSYFPLKKKKSPTETT